MERTTIEIPFIIVAAFSRDELGYLGNPTAVVFLDQAASDEWYRQVASDFNQPATTFLIPKTHPNHFDVRWFAPDAEIELCGHGSFGAGVALFNKSGLNEVILHPKIGTPIRVTTTEGICSMKIQAIPCQAAAVPEGLAAAIGEEIQGFFTSNNKQIIVLDSEKQVAQLKPNFTRLANQKYFGFAVTASAKGCDFVSRTFVPKVQQLEDHATGSSHAVLAPFWAAKRNRKKLTAKQLSSRGGFFHCEVNKSEVTLSGNYRIIANGNIFKP